MKLVQLKKTLLILAPFIATALMLTVIQPPFNCSQLAWVSLVPFLLACLSKVKTSVLVIISYFVAVVYWLVNIYWIIPVTGPGWLVLSMYLAVLWPLIVIAIRYCIAKKIPLFLAVPIFIVAAERLQGLFMGGFYWRFLAHSQYANITLIQIADIFGAEGLSLLIALINLIVAELLIAAYKKNSLKASLFLKTALACTLLVATVFYGRYRIQQSENTVRAGPLVASVQSNVPQTTKEIPDASEKIFKDLLELSKDASRTGAELIVWPETMVQEILNENVWPFLLDSKNAENFGTALKEHSKDNAFLLVGATGGKIKQRDDTNALYLERYNTAFFYEPSGQQSKTKYNKIHLVPFGEVIPFKYSVPWLHKFFMFFTPYDYDYSLEHGTDYTAFAIADSNGEGIYKFSVMICYEDAVPLIARNFALDEHGQKRIDWLVNISNDGWFVKLKKNKILTTTELNQHAAICVFRAVENRLAVLRSVNTGISCLVDTLGRIKNGFAYGTLPNQAMQRRGIAGWFADKMPIDTRTTFFSKHGQWLDFFCAVCLAFTVIAQTGESLLKCIKKRTIK